MAANKLKNKVMIGKIALVLFYLLSPAAVLWACNKWKVLNKIGPVLILYFLGIIVANLNLIPPIAPDCRTPSPPSPSLWHCQ